MPDGEEIVAAEKAQTVIVIQALSCFDLFNDVDEVCVVCGRGG
jgi:hypothetical protein